jgi:hypothetical protein
VEDSAIKLYSSFSSRVIETFSYFFIKTMMKYKSKHTFPLVTIVGFFCCFGYLRNHARILVCKDVFGLNSTAEPIVLRLAD